MESKHEWAQRYAARGWRVFPLTPGQKVPLKGTSGFKEATTDLNQINQWWADHPKANIGIATGAGSGLWVIDLDVKNGKDGVFALREFMPDGAGDPETMQVLTASGGRHIYLGWNDTQCVKSRANVLSGVDIRGEGGYVVAPPSEIEVGHYSWFPEYGLPVAEAPQWAMNLALKDASSPTGTVEGRKHKVDPSKKLPWDLQLKRPGNWSLPIGYVEIGRKYVCLCPFHEDRSPSAFFYRHLLTSGYLYCSACDKTWFTERRAVLTSEISAIHDEMKKKEDSYA